MQLKKSILLAPQKCEIGDNDKYDRNDDRDHDYLSRIGLILFLQLTFSFTLSHIVGVLSD